MMGNERFRCQQARVTHNDSPHFLGHEMDRGLVGETDDRILYIWLEYYRNA